MASIWGFFILLQLCQVLAQGSKGWRWSRPLSDEEIVDLLYSNPDKLRSLSDQMDDGQYSAMEGNEIARLKPHQPAISGYHEDSGSTKRNRASSYTRVEHFPPKQSAKQDFSTYTNHILHS